MSNYYADPKRYDGRMPYRRCGNSGLMLPLLSLGTWHGFGDSDDFSNMQKMIFTAFDAGITHFDLADNYGPPQGSAEINVGRILKNDLSGHRDELIISTKAGWDTWPGPYGNLGSRKHIIASCDQCLARTGLEYFDIFYSHRPDTGTPMYETMTALDTLVRQGKALYIGISAYSTEQAKEAQAIFKELKTPYVINQPNYNMTNRTIETGGLLDYCYDEGVGVITFSPLSQGLLTNRYLDGIPSDSRAGRKTGVLQPNQITPEVLTMVRALNEVAAKRGQTLAQMAIAWVLRDKEKVTSVLIGASKPEQIEENLKILDNLEFSAEELAEIDNILA